MFKACSFSRTDFDTRRASNVARFARAPLGVPPFFRARPYLSAGYNLSFLGRTFLRLPLAFNKVHIAIDGEVAEAFHTLTRVVPLHLNPVYLRALAYAHDYAGIVRGKVASASRFAEGSLQVARLPGNPGAEGVGITLLRHQPCSQPVVKLTHAILEHQRLAVVDRDQHVERPVVVKIADGH